MIKEQQYKSILKEVQNEQDFDKLDYIYTYNKVIKEQDFYPPPDDRVLKSYVEDIDGGDNFADYCEYIFEILDEEDYFEN